MVEPTVDVTTITVDSSTAMDRSCPPSSKLTMDPSCIHNHRPYRHGEQLLRRTGVPVEARTGPKSSGAWIRLAPSRRFSSLQAGWVLSYAAGVDPLTYHPTPEPSPFVEKLPNFTRRLCSIIECSSRQTRSSARTGSPCRPSIDTSP